MRNTEVKPRRRVRLTSLPPEAFARAVARILAKPRTTEQDRADGIRRREEREAARRG